MNTRVHFAASVCGLLALTSPVWAGRAAALDSAAQPASPSSTKFTTAELEELLGSIALYPDTLLANVLAASVYPDEVAEAAAFMKSGGDAKAVDQRAWEPAVKAVAKLPEVIGMMGEFPEWTVALGQAYLAQAQEVMATVQSLRKKAQSNGALVSSPQQTVVVEPDVIYIQSPDPEIVYVPSYEPQYVYVDHYNSGDVVAAGLIGFGAGILVGSLWNDLDCDWHGGCVGWGGGYHNDVDIDIDRNFNGDINIGSGNNINRGDRVNTRPRAGQEGNAWRPNSAKQTAANRPSQANNFRNSGAGGTRASAPRASTADRARAGGGGARPSTQPAGGNRPSAGARPSAQPAAGGGTRMPSATNRPATPSNAGRSPSASPSRMPANTPSANRGGDSAFRGGSGTAAQSNRGASSRSSAGTSRSSPSRSSGGSRGGGGGSRGGGGGRGGGGRR